MPRALGPPGRGLTQHPDAVLCVIGAYALHNIMDERAMNPAGPGGIGRQSVPGAANCGTPMPSPILRTRLLGCSDVCRSPTGASGTRCYQRRRPQHTLW